jgi:hypothetical protein
MAHPPPRHEAIHCHRSATASLLMQKHNFLKPLPLLYTLCAWMRRALTIAVLLVVTTVSSAPAFAFAIADHSCCAAERVATAHSVTAKTGGAAKSAHCAAMAQAAAEAQKISQFPVTASFAAQHKCQQCALNVMTAPGAASALTPGSRTALASSLYQPASQSRLHAFQFATINSGRAPPSFL